MPETPQNPEQTAPQSPENQEEQRLQAEMEKYRESLLEIKSGETKFTLGIETQNEFVNSLLPALEKGLQNRMNELAQDALTSRNSLARETKDFLNKNILLNEQSFSVPISGHGFLSLGEVGGQTAIGFSNNDGLSFQAVVDDSIQLTKVRAAYLKKDSEVALGFNPSDQSVEASWAKKFEGEDYSASLGARVFHETERNNTGIGVGFSINF